MFTSSLSEMYGSGNPTSALEAGHPKPPRCALRVTPSDICFVAFSCNPSCAPPGIHW